MATAEFRLAKSFAQLYGLSTEMLDQLGCFGDILAHDPFAPTNIREPKRVVSEHLIDALTILPFQDFHPAERLIDIGSGCGVPGVVLAIARPKAQYVLLDASQRKTRFLESVVQRLSLKNVAVVHERVETHALVEPTSFDYVLARALAVLPVLVEYAAPLLKDGGQLIAWKGKPPSSEQNAALVAADAVSMQAAECHTPEPWFDVRDRRLYLYRKSGQTPAKFPRRPGVATKRPLGFA